MVEDKELPASPPKFPNPRRMVVLRQVSTRGVREMWFAEEAWEDFVNMLWSGLRRDESIDPPELEVPTT